MSKEIWQQAQQRLEGDLGPALARFAAELGFVRDVQVGFYPRIRLVKALPSSGSLWIDLWMTLDAEGRYRDTFAETTPFELSGGKSVEVGEDGLTVRYSLAKEEFVKPYAELAAAVPGRISALAQHIESTSDEAVIRTGRRTPLAAGSAGG